MIGEKNTVTFTVGPERLASHMGSGDLDVLATPAIVAAEGRRVDFTVSARDAAGEIGRGTHSRVIVDAARFQQKTDAKAGAAE